MVVAKEILVVTKHQKQITTPQHHVHFHKGNNAGVACHGLCHDNFALVAETNFLYPSNKITAVERNKGKETLPNLSKRADRRASPKWFDACRPLQRRQR